MTPSSDGLPRPQRYLAALTLALSVTMSVLDGAIANIALPSIARDMHVPAAQSIWVVNAYQLSIAMSLLALSSFGEIIGYRRIYRAGIVLFTLTSLLCACADSLLTLTVARALQGFGAAGIMSVNTAILRLVYPRKLLARGISINALVVAFAAAAGPSAAGLILSYGDWHWLFAINLPFGIAAAILAWRVLPENGFTTHHRYDRAGAWMTAATITLLVIALDGVGRGGDFLWVTAILGAALGFALWRRETRLDVPLVPVDLLRIPAFRLSVLTSICAFTSQMLAMVALPFIMQGELGLGQTQTGFLLTTWPVAVMCIAPLAGRLSDRVPPGMLGAIGLLTMGIGMAALTTLSPQNASTWSFIWRVALCGAGFALFQTPNNLVLLTVAPAHRGGGASGMLSTSRLLGQTLGAALTALFFARNGGGHNLWPLYAGAGFAWLAAIVSALRLRGPAAIQPVGEQGAVPAEP